MKSIQFCVKAQAEFGQALYLVHSQNNWQLNQSSRMSWVSSSRWKLDLHVNQSEIEYKYVISDFELTNNSIVSWEKGPNRILQVDKIKRFVRNEKWEKRRILISHPQLFDHSLMIVIGDNFAPKKMKLFKIKGQHYFCSTFDIDSAQENQQLNFQYYLLHYGKQPQEYISSSLYVPVSQDSMLRLEDVPFYQISNI